MRRYGGLRGALLTLCLPALPGVLCVAELIKRLAELLPNAEVDWKMAGPGRVFFERPPKLVASLLWDGYLAVSVFVGSFLQYGNDPDALMHTWHAPVPAAPPRPPAESPPPIRRPQSAIP